MRQVKVLVLKSALSTFFHCFNYKLFIASSTLLLCIQDYAQVLSKVLHPMSGLKLVNFRINFPLTL